MVNFFRLIAANEIKTDRPFKNHFWFDLEELTEVLNYYQLSTDFQNIPKAKNLEDAIKADDQSPACLKYLGDLYKQKEKPDLAKEHYLKALSILPEYGQASFSLAMLYRSHQQHSLAIPHFIDAFASPFYFSNKQGETLRMLAAYKDDTMYDSQDPLWNRRRHKIKLDDGEKYPTFHKVLNEVIEEYLELKQFRRAIGLRLFLGLFARNDERLIHRYQLKDHQNLLRQNLETAQMEKRILLLGL